MRMFISGCAKYVFRTRVHAYYASKEVTSGHLLHATNMQTHVDAPCYIKTTKRHLHVEGLRIYHVSILVMKMGIVHEHAAY